MLLTGIVLAVLRVIEIERTDFANHESLHVGVITFLRNGIGLFGDVQLGKLVVVLFDKDKKVLIEVHRLLTQFAFRNVAITLRHLDLSASFSPIDQRDLYTDLNNLIVSQMAIRRTKLIVRSGIADLRIKGDLAKIALRLRHLIIGLQLPADHITAEGIVLIGFREHLVIVQLHGRILVGHHRLQIYVVRDIEERA